MKLGKRKIKTLEMIEFRGCSFFFSNRAAKVSMMSFEEKIIGSFVDNLFDKTRFLIHCGSFPKVDVFHK